MWAFCDFYRLIHNPAKSNKVVNYNKYYYAENLTFISHCSSPFKLYKSASEA